MKQSPITSVNSTFNVALITVCNIPPEVNFLAQVFSAVSDEGINVDMISQTAPINSSTNVSFTVDDEDMFKVITSLNKLKKDIPSIVVEVDPNNVKLEVGGKEIITTPGVAARIFRLMAENSIDIKIITTSESKISILLYEKDSQAAESLIKGLAK